jgi:hypothetical protein
MLAKTDTKKPRLTPGLLLIYAVLETGDRIRTGDPENFRARELHGLDQPAPIESVPPWTPAVPPLSVHFSATATVPEFGGHDLTLRLTPLTL